MTPEKAFQLVGVQDTIAFVYQPVEKSVLPEEVEQALLVLQQREEDPWKYYGLNFDWTNPFGIADKLNTLVKNIRDLWRKVLDIFHFVWQAISHGARDWWNEIWEAIRRQYYNFTEEFFKFTRDPLSYLKEHIVSPIKRAIQHIKTVGIDIWRFVNRIRGAISNLIRPLIRSVKNTIVNWITDRINAVRNWINNLRESVLREIDLAIKTIQFFPEEFRKNLRRFLGSTTEQIENAVRTVLRTFDFGLGGLVDAVRSWFVDIGTKIWDWLKGIVTKIGGFLSERVLKPIWSQVKGVFTWLWGILKRLWSEAKELMYRMAPSAPERGEELIDQALTLLGAGAGMFGGMTGMSMMVGWLSNYNLGRLSAILYDMSSYKYISAAVMGGLVTVAYKQPLKYFYNAKFRPYLPSWGDTMEAFGRSKISDGYFRFFLKYGGISDDYFKIYKEIASKPISAFMIRYIAEAEIVDPEGVFRICMDAGYSREKAKYMAEAMSYGALGSYRRKAESSVTKCYREGFITKEEFSAAIGDIRASHKVPATYKTTDDYTYSVTIEAPRPSKELLQLDAKWKIFYNTTKEKVDILEEKYDEEMITEDEFRTKAGQLIKDPSRIDAIVRKIKVKKYEKPEPTKGKKLRDALKSIFRRCYREGFITWSRLRGLIADANRLVDEATLILQRANWEAFYDDMKDLVDIYEEKLEEGVISEAQFRRDLIDKGLRPEKVGLKIKLWKAKQGERI